MRIIHVCTIGGSATSLLRPQCEYLRRAGHEVGFVFSPGPAADRLRQAGFAVGAVPISRRITPADMRAVWMLVKYLRQQQPHIVHTIHGFPFVEGQSPLTYRTYAAMERGAARLTDLLLSQSAEDIETARRLGIRARSGDPVFLGNGVDLDRFRPGQVAAEQQLAWRQELQLPDGPVLTIIARQNGEKGYLELIAALRQIADLPWTALFVGPDEGAGGRIRQLVAQSGLAPRVRLLGARSDIPELLAITDLYTLPSHREGVPRSVIEAHAMGIPAVVTDVRGCREVVVDGETGRVVPRRDPGALRSLLRNADQRRRMGAAARRRAEERFDERQVFDRLTAAYARLVERPRRMVGAG